MVNGHGITHGAFVFAVADTAFACACNSHGPLSVAAAVDITFVAPSTRRRCPRSSCGGTHPLRSLGDLRASQCDAGMLSSRNFGALAAPSGRVQRDHSRLSAASRAARRGERLSRDALLDLQLERLRWSLQHAYTNVGALPAGLRGRGGDARRLPDARRPRAISAPPPSSIFADNYPFGMFAVPRAGGASHPCLQRHHRKTHGGRLYAG